MAALVIRLRNNNDEGQGKLFLLPRPWPLLADHQDPASLEARVAFHLHRLGLVGRALREAGYNKNDAADIAAGRLSLNSVGAASIAERLGIAVQQITRALSDGETRSWSFYRRAAVDPQHLWVSARNAWRAAFFFGLDTLKLRLEPLRHSGVN